MLGALGALVLLSLIQPEAVSPSARAMEDLLGLSRRQRLEKRGRRVRWHFLFVAPVVRRNMIPREAEEVLLDMLKLSNSFLDGSFEEELSEASLITDFPVHGSFNYDERGIGWDSFDAEGDRMILMPFWIELTMDPDSEDLVMGEEDPLVEFMRYSMPEWMYRRDFFFQIVGKEPEVLDVSEEERREFEVRRLLGDEMDFEDPQTQKMVLDLLWSLEPGQLVDL